MAETRLGRLLAQAETLERHEITELQNWLHSLEGDCATFGETAEDRQRIASIKRRLNKEGVDLSR